MIIPEARLLQSILVQVIKDYKTNFDSRPIIERWVKDKQGTFDLIAVALDIEESELQRKLLLLFSQLRRGIKLRKRPPKISL